VAHERVAVVGDRVYRAAGWWNPDGACALLKYRHGVGFTRVPSGLMWWTVRKSSGSYQAIPERMAGDRP
jgi:hypothetical protein